MIFCFRSTQDNIEEKQKREIQVMHTYKTIEVLQQSYELLAFEHKRIISSIKKRIRKKYTRFHQS